VLPCRRGRASAGLQDPAGFSRPGRGAAPGAADGHDLRLLQKPLHPKDLLHEIDLLGAEA